MVSKSDKQKKKKKKKERKKVLCSFSYPSPFILSFPPLLQFPFFSSPFSLASLFLYLLFFPLPSLFTPFPLPSKITSQTFHRWATRPTGSPLVTPLAGELKKFSGSWPGQLSIRICTSIKCLYMGLKGSVFDWGHRSHAPSLDMPLEHNLIVALYKHEADLFKFVDFSFEFWIWFPRKQSRFTLSNMKYYHSFAHGWIQILIFYQTCHVRVGGIAF